LKRLLTLAVIGALLMTSCTGPPAGDGTLAVYSGRSQELVQPLIDDFEAATGIDVNVRYAGSTELAATLLAEGETTDADVFFAQDPGSLGSVAAMMMELPDSILEQVDAKFRDHDGLWVGTSGRVRVFVYNVEGDRPLPQTIDEATGPAWSGQLGIAPTNGSFLAFVAAMILERGEEGTRAWLEALASNGPVDYPSNSPIVAATDSGEIQGGLVNHYYLLRLRAEGAGQSAENHFIPAGDVGTLVMPAGAGILAGTDQPDAAHQFIEFLLSLAAQTYFANETFEFPLIDGVDPVEGLPRLSEIKTPEIDLSRLADVLEKATQLVAEAGLV
jgi:iron(III) transport system substrate-binding protein